MKKSKQKKSQEHANVGALMDSQKPKTEKVVKEREINRIGYVGQHVSKRRLRHMAAGMTGVAKATFRDWFKDELRVPHRRASAKSA